MTGFVDDTGYGLIENPWYNTIVNSRVDIRDVSRVQKGQPGIAGSEPALLPAGIRI